MPEACQFWLQGNCRYGVQCRNLHTNAGSGQFKSSGAFGSFGNTSNTSNQPVSGFSFLNASSFGQNNQAQSSNRFSVLGQNPNQTGMNEAQQFFVDTLKSDLIGTERPVWKLSSYAHSKEAKQMVVSNADISPEEVRLQAMQSLKAGQLVQASIYWQQAHQNMDQKVKAVMDNPMLAYQTANGAQGFVGAAERAVTTSAFGGGGFGSSAFGSAGQTSAFGGTTSSAFGQQTNPSGFGQQTTPSVFGANSTPSAFGATSAPSAFGATSTPSAFGTTSTAAFGQSTSSTFGQPAFGSTSLGTGSTSAFGQANAPISGFGSSGFGQKASAFGQTGSPSTFGQPASGFGQATSSGFGQTAAPGFGQPTSSGFGQPASSSGVGQATSSGFGQQTSSGFGNNTSLSRGFGQTQPPLVPDFPISPEEEQAYLAREFEFGKIPETCPPIRLRS